MLVQKKSDISHETALRASLHRVLRHSTAFAPFHGPRPNQIFLSPRGYSSYDVALYSEGPCT